MEKLNREEKSKLKSLYDAYFDKKNKSAEKELFQLYSKITGKTEKPTNCSTCLIKIKEVIKNNLQ